MKNLKIWLVASCLFVLASLISIASIWDLGGDYVVFGVIGLAVSLIHAYFVNGVIKNFEILNDKIDGKNKDEKK